MTKCTQKIEDATEQEVPESGREWICSLTDKYGVSTDEISKSHAKDLGKKAIEYDKNRKEGYKNFLGAGKTEEKQSINQG